jgi:hypothetical protein
MKDTLHVSSLCPYLETQRAPFSLQLSPISDDSSVMERASFPFRIISDAAPLTRLIEARLITGAESEIKRVFLLIQKDSYSLAADATRPLNNLDIDNAWQNAFSGSRHKEANNSAIILPAQVDRREEKERLVPFQPLFYCRKKKLFFEPPCPQCGTSLRQCYDDDLLTRSGLLPYSTSLKRYLYCPVCADSKDECDFYTFALEGLDSPLLMDRRDLIRRFGRLIESKNKLDHFPCLECDGNRECYGPDNRCLSRVLPFAFYPFYLLIFEAMSLHALDFLALLGGAPFEELETTLTTARETGRADCLKAVRHRHTARAFTFFNQGEKYFYEVLYLKLSFLGECLQTAFSGLTHGQQPDQGLSLDRIWVRLASQSGFLPLFWSFSAGSIDLNIHSFETSLLPRTLPLSNLYFSGLAWFSTFLINHDQHVTLVHQAVEKAVSASGSCDQLPDFDLAEKSRTFFPENIFWFPERGIIPESGRIFWERCLNLGWSLLHAGYYTSSRWSKEVFWEQFEILREEVKESLFQGKEVISDQLSVISEKEVISDQLSVISENQAVNDQLPVAGGKEVGSEKEVIREKEVISDQLSVIDEKTDNFKLKIDNFSIDPGENKAIHDILIRILGQWRSVTNEKQEVKTDEKQEVSTDIEETMMLSPESIIAQASPTPSIVDNGDTAGTTGHTASSREEDELLETVIISPQKQPAPMTHRSSLTRHGPGPEVTVSPGKPEQAAPAAPAGEEDGLLKTVIISPQKQSSPMDQGIPGAQTATEAEVTICPEKPEQETPVPKPEPEQEDFLTETVILRSNKFQDSNKKESS